MRLISQRRLASACLRNEVFLPPKEGKYFSRVIEVKCTYSKNPPTLSVQFDEV